MAREKTLFELIEFLSQERHTIADIQHKFNIGQRMTYRYLKAIEREDLALEQDFDKRWFIMKCRCPLCGRDLANG